MSYSPLVARALPLLLLPMITIATEEGAAANDVSAAKPTLSKYPDDGLCSACKLCIACEDDCHLCKKDPTIDEMCQYCSLCELCTHCSSCEEGGVLRYFSGSVQGFLSMIGMGSHTDKLTNLVQHKRYTQAHAALNQHDET